MADVKLAEALSNVFGPSGSEKAVTEVIRGEMQGFLTWRDPMMNLYAARPGEEAADERPTVMLDAHTDEVGFMVQSVTAGGLLKLVPLGGWIDSNIPAHLFWVENTRGELIRAISSSKPPHFMSAAERAKPIELADIALDLGVTSREEVFAMGIEPGCAAAPEVYFHYNEKSGVMMGKAFDCRLGCACVVEAMKKLEGQKTNVRLIGAFATQEEVGCRGAKVTAQTVKPNLAIVFEGTPSDDFFMPEQEAQGRMKQGVQIRFRDSGMVANAALAKFAVQLAKEKEIPYQCAVRTSGGTNGGVIHLTENGIPTLVLGIPVRYAHTHYCYSAAADVDAAVALACAVIQQLDRDKMETLFA